MKEKTIQTLFSKVCNIRGVFELKITKKSSIAYSVVKPHQEEALLKANNKGFFHKITDQPIFGGMKTRFNRPKPFDCFYVTKYPAYVAICYYKPRQPKELILINISDFITARETDTRKSLTEEKAKSISSQIISLK